jgi:hypothetical protein
MTLPGHVGLVVFDGVLRGPFNVVADINSRDSSAPGVRTSCAPLSFYSFLHVANHNFADTGLAKGRRFVEFVSTV